MAGEMDGDHDHASASSHKYTNRLAKEHSPYLLQHAHNPKEKAGAMPSQQDAHYWAEMGAEANDSEEDDTSVASGSGGSSVPVVALLNLSVTNYVITRPTREILFTVTTREEKYKAKVIIDTFVQRLGDAAAAGVYKMYTDCGRRKVA